MPHNDETLSPQSAHANFVSSLLFSPKGPSTARAKRLKEEERKKRLHAISTSHIPFATRWIFRPLFILFIICGSPYWYVLVQVRSTWPVTLVLIVAEMLSYALTCLFFCNFWFSTERNKVSFRSTSPKFHEDLWPHVDVYFTHFLEPVETLRNPLSAALGMDYPYDKLHIKILDDGFLSKGDEGQYNVTPLGQEMENMVQDVLNGVRPNRMRVLGHFVPRRHAAHGGFLLVTFNDEELPQPDITIVARMKGEETHFKIGNLENALYNVGSRSLFVALFDTDMEPHRDFLVRTLPLFYWYDHAAQCWRPDWKVGFVQTPQRFHNVIRRFGPDDPLYQSNGVFFSAIQTGRDGLGLTIAGGTNSVFFRPALEDSLGMVYGCLAGEAATGDKLQRFGWKGLYLNAALASGLTRNYVGSTYVERKRWVIGTVQMFLLWLGWRGIFSSRFLKPPLRLQTNARLAALRERPEKFVTPLDPDDTGFESRQARRDSYTLWLARTVLFLDLGLKPLTSVIAFMFIWLGLVYLFFNVPPIVFYREGDGWLPGAGWLAAVAFFQGLRILTLSIGCQQVFIEGGTSGQDVWREVQSFFFLAWPSLLGIIEAVASAIRGRPIKWETEKKNVQPLVELPNVVLCLAISAGIVVATCNIFFDVTTPKRRPMEGLGAVGYGMFLMVCLGPSSRTTLAAVLRLPLWSFKLPKFIANAAGMIVGIIIVAMVGHAAQTPPSRGAFERRDYPDIFAAYNFANTSAVYQRVQGDYTDLFYGQDRVFWPRVDTQLYNDGAFILDSETGLVLSYQMAYAMMVSVQLDARQPFDQLWKWTKDLLLIQDPQPFAGYHAAKATAAGVVVDWIPDPDAEQYFATALLFAGARWQAKGPDASGDYRDDAHSILRTMMFKERLNGGVLNGVTNMFTNGSRTIVDEPTLEGQLFTRSALVNPALYEAWKRFAPKRFGGGSSGLWATAAAASRALLQVSANSASGLYPNFITVNGIPYAGYNSTGLLWSEDAWRTAPNVAMDSMLWDRTSWETSLSVRFVSFLQSEGLRYYGLVYQATTNQLLQQASDDAHRAGLTAINCIPALDARAQIDPTPFLSQLWSLSPSSFMVPSNQKRTYHSLLYLLSMLVTSGNFRVYDPTYGAGPE